MENRTSEQWVGSLSWDGIQVLRMIFAIAGIVGNTLVIVVYVHRRRMRNTTNAFIVNLAVADLVTSAFIFPIPSYTAIPMTWTGRLYCKVIFNVVFMWTAIVASIFTLTLVSLERYCAVVHPMRYRVIFSKWRPRAAMAGAWLCSAGLNTFNLYVVDLHEGGFCYNNWPSRGFRYLIATAVFFVEYFVPMAVMLVANVVTVRTLKQQARALLQRDQSRFSPAYSLLQARRKVIETISAVIVTFVVCWTPDQIGFYVYHLGGVPDSYIVEPLYRSMVLLAFANCCANPIIYAFKNKHFRHGFMNMLRMKGNRVGSNAGSVAGEDEFPTANVTVLTARPIAVPRVVVPN